MWKSLLLLASVGVVQGIIFNENVAFRKVNEVTTTRARWVVSLVIDLDPYKSLMTKLREDIFRVGTFAGNAVRQCCPESEDRFGPSFDRLAERVDIIKESFGVLQDEFSSYLLLYNRGKRSLIPVIGQALNFLFGTVDESDLSDIDRHVEELAAKQTEIAHIVEDSISIIKLSGAKITENRQTIVKLANDVSKLNEKLINVSNHLQTELFRFEAFSSMYSGLELVIDELDENLFRAGEYLRRLQLQLNLLSFGKLAPSVITPGRLKSILREINSKLTLPMRLPSDPERELWEYYKFLSCTTLIQSKRVLIVVPIPLIDSNNKFDIFEVYSLPSLYIPPSDASELKPMVAQYELESTAIAVDVSRTKIALLSPGELTACSNPVVGFCAIGSPIYPLGLSKFCVAGLFSNRTDIVVNNCMTKVELDTKLPRAKYLAEGMWLVSSVQEMHFSVSCHDRAATFIRSQPPVNIVKLGMGCMAVNEKLTLTPYYQRKSEFDVNTTVLYKQIKLSTTGLWEPFHKIVSNFSKITIPKDFKFSDEVDMDHLLSRIRYAKRSIKRKTNFFKTTLFHILLGSFLAVAVIVTVFILIKLKIIKVPWTTTINKILKGSDGAVPSTLGADDDTVERVANSAVAAPSSSPLVTSTGQTESPSIKFYPSLA